MSIRIDLDSLLQVAQELAYDSPGTLIPLLHTNRQIYDLASHLLLLRPDGSYVRVLLPADGDSGGQRRVEGFRDFVLGLKSRHSRRFYLRKLHLEPPWVDSYLSRDSMKMLAEVFDPCFRHPSQDTSPLESTVQLETLRLWMDGLDEMVPLASHLLRLEVETLRTFVCETPWSLPLARLFKEVRAPLRILDLNGKPGLYPLHNLAPLRDTLQELRISLPNAGIFDLTATEGGDIPVFPNVSTLKILGWVIIVNTKTLIETFPSLRHLDIRADVTLRRGYRWSFRPPQRDENIKAMAGCGGNLWSELHSVAGSVQMLYDLALTCKVYLLYLYNADHELDNAGKARDVCADVRPEILHYCCPLSGAFPTCASALEGCASSVKEFSMEVLLGGLSGDGYGDGLNHEGKQREITNFFKGIVAALKATRVNTVNIHLHLKGIWAPESMDRLGDEASVNFSPCRSIFEDILSVDWEVFLPDLISDLQDVVDFTLKIGSYGKSSYWEDSLNIQKTPINDLDSQHMWTSKKCSWKGHPPAEDYLMPLEQYDNLHSYCLQ